MKVTSNFKSKLYTYFVKRLGAFNYRNGWLKVPVCPFCGRELKLGINLNTYRTNCFKCGYHSNPSQLIMDVEGIETYNELLKLLDNGEFTEYTFKEERVQLRERKVFYLPEGFRLVSQGRNQLAKSVRGYLRKRGFSSECLSKAGVGYCTTGSFFGYLIIPFYYHGQLRYYNARLVYGRGPRYNNPTTDITGIGKEFMLYNSTTPSSSARVLLMPLLSENGPLLLWVKPSQLIRLTNLLNLQLKGSSCYWTLMLNWPLSTLHLN